MRVIVVFKNPSRNIKVNPAPIVNCTCQVPGIARTRMYGDPSHPGLCLFHLLVGRSSGQLGLGGLLWELARASDDWSHLCRRGLVCKFTDIPAGGGLCTRGLSMLCLVFWIDRLGRDGTGRLGLVDRRT